jgi:pentatricopeptide repeat protein
MVSSAGDIHCAYINAFPNKCILIYIVIWLAKMEAAGVTANVVSYNTIIDAWAKDKKPAKAEEWLAKMEAAGVTANVRACTCVCIQPKSPPLHDDSYIETPEWCFDEGILLKDRTLFAGPFAAIEEKHAFHATCPHGPHFIGLYNALYNRYCIYTLYCVQYTVYVQYIAHIQYTEHIQYIEYIQGRSPVFLAATATSVGPHC